MSDWLDCIWWAKLSSIQCGLCLERWFIYKGQEGIESAARKDFSLVRSTLSGLFWCWRLKLFDFRVVARNWFRFSMVDCLSLVFTMDAWNDWYKWRPVALQCLKIYWFKYIPPEITLVQYGRLPFTWFYYWQREWHHLSEGGSKQWFSPSHVEMTWLQYCRPEMTCI